MLEGIGAADPTICAHGEQPLDPPLCLSIGVLPEPRQPTAGDSLQALPIETVETLATAFDDFYQARVLQDFEVP